MAYHEQKDRVFVRPIAGEYNLTQELARLRSLPRVIKGREPPFHSGPQQFSKHYMEPKDGLGPDPAHPSRGILAGRHIAETRSRQRGRVLHPRRHGAEVHDGVRYEWEAGDAAIVHNNCVHQHFNRSPDNPARAWS